MNNAVHDTAETIPLVDLRALCAAASMLALRAPVASLDERKRLSEAMLDMLRGLGAIGCTNGQPAAWNVSQ
jgi:hypothetical protein